MVIIGETFNIGTVQYKMVDTFEGRCVNFDYCDRLRKGGYELIHYVGRRVLANGKLSKKTVNFLRKRDSAEFRPAL